MNLATKYLITAGLIVVISEAAKRSDKLGAIIGALPLMTILTLTWLYIENQPTEKIANHAYYTFWYVLPTLPMFLAFPFLLTQVGFMGALAASILITAASFTMLALILRSWGISLL